MRQRQKAEAEAEAEARVEAEARAEAEAEAMERLKQSRKEKEREREREWGCVGNVLDLSLITIFTQLCAQTPNSCLGWCVICAFHNLKVRPIHEIHVVVRAVNQIVIKFV